MDIVMMLVNFNSFLIRIQKTHVMVGLILAAFGLAIIFLAKRIASVARKEELRDQPIGNDNKVYIALKALGLVMLLVALIIMVFE